MNQSDPTDHALAAIASILDRPAVSLAPKVEAEPAPQPDSRADETTEESDILPVPSPVAVQPEIDIDHYEKFGPGPLAAIRFRWAARRDDLGNYYVDETIGPNSRPLSTGPMPKNEVIAFIEQRAHEAEQRFQVLKDEMTISTHRPDQFRHDGGES